MERENNLISEISITLIRPHDDLLAFASCVYQGLYLGSIAVRKRLDGGFRLSYPLQKISDNKKIQVFFPVNSATGNLLSSQIISKFQKLSAKGVMTYEQEEFKHR